MQVEMESMRRCILRVEGRTLEHLDKIATAMDQLNQIAAKLHERLTAVEAQVFPTEIQEEVRGLGWLLSQLDKRVGELSGTVSRHGSWIVELEDRVARHVSTPHSEEH